MAKQEITEITEADVLERAKGFWAKYSKKIIIVGTAVIVVMGSYLAYKHLYSIPQAIKGSEAVFTAEKLFDKMTSTGSYNKDTVNMVLNGDKATNTTGILKVISSYGGTPSGNRAKFIAGACYLHLQQFDKAIKYLKDFDGNGAKQVQSKAYMMIGHAYAEQKKQSDALDYYKKAASIDDEDEGMATEALYTAGRYAEATGNTKEAVSLFQKLKDNYPASQRVTSGDADKYLAKLGVIN